MTPDTKSFRGSYLLFRKDGTGLRRARKTDPARPPRFRHPTFEAAEAEASRLLGLHPESTFVILQEVARVKLKESAPTVKCEGCGNAIAEGAGKRWADDVETCGECSPADRKE